MHYQAYLSTYLQLGLHVLPLHYITENGQCSCGNSNCKSPGKHPATSRGVYDATAEPHTVWSFWSQRPYNIGIVTGLVNNCIVVDVDPRNGGLDTLSALNLNTNTLAVSTGGNGYHYYYQYPTEEIKLPGKLGDGIELKKDNGYVVAPPSNHASGNTYKWINNEPLLSAQCVIDVLPEKKRPEDHGGSVDDLEQNFKEKKRYAQYKLNEYTGALAKTESNRMITLNNHAYYLGGLVSRGLLQYDHVYSALEKAALHAGLEKYEVDSALPGSLSSGMKNPVDLSHIDEKHKIDQWWKACQEGMYKSKIDAVEGQLDGIENRRLKKLLLHNDRTVPTQPLDPGEDWTPNGLARRLKEIYKEHFGYCPVYTRGNIYVYHTSGEWAVIDPEYLSLPLWWSGAYNPKYEKPLQINRMGSGAKTLNNLLKTLEEMTQNAVFFENSKPGIYFKNGRFWDGALHTHSPDNRSLFVIPHEYDPNASPAAWDQFMDTVLPDKELQQAFHEFIGLALFGKTHSYEVAMLMHGVGNNGKSTTLDVVRTLFDPKYVTSVEPQDMAKPDFAVKLLNSKVNIVADMSSRDLRDGAPLKKVISGEQIQAKYLYKDRFDFSPRTAVIMAANELPALGDQTKGFARKLLILPFDQEIPREKDIKDYWKILVREGLPGLIIRAIEGYETVTRRGYLKIPGKAREALKEWKVESDNVSQFLEQYIEKVSENNTVDWVSNTDLYMDFKVWTDMYGDKRDQIGLRTFTNRLKSMGIKQTRRRGGRGYTFESLRSCLG